MDTHIPLFPGKKYIPQPKIYIPYNPETVTIILQGVINRTVDVGATIEKYSPHAKIILSVYDDLKTTLYCTSLKQRFPKITIIYNNLATYKQNVRTLPEIWKVQNYYFQIQTTQKALENVVTKYVVKTRIDHFYDDIHKFISHGIQNAELGKITTGSCFVRGIHHIKYHMSDCLFFGTTEQINKVLHLASQRCEGYCAEVKLWKPYILDLNPDIENISPHEYLAFMEKTFAVYCINLHSSYILNFSFSQIPITKITDVDKSDRDYFIFGTEFCRPKIRRIYNKNVLLPSLPEPPPEKTYADASTQYDIQEKTDSSVQCDATTV